MRLKQFEISSLSNSHDSSLRLGFKRHDSLLFSELKSVEIDNDVADEHEAGPVARSL